jgi:hypothetical protein
LRSTKLLESRNAGEDIEFLDHRRPRGKDEARHAFDEPGERRLPRDPRPFFR